MRWLLVPLLLASCASPVVPPTAAAPPPPPPPAVNAPPPPPVKAAPAPLTWRGDYCKTDAQCAWDDPCTPSRCVEAKTVKPVECEESAPRPGTCACVEDMCTLRPADPGKAEATGVCKKDDECAVDVASASCHAGGTALIGPIYQEGPVCTCDAAAGRCRYEWAGPVQCKTWRDCSWIRTPRLRPVPSTRVKRPVNRPVRACKDGEIDSVCTPEGTCKIVGWSC